MKVGRQRGSPGAARLWLLAAAALIAAALMPRAAAAASEQVLYSFCAQFSCADGDGPRAGLLMDAAGNLYGTTVDGGAGSRRGAVFKLAPDGTQTVLYSFCPQFDCTGGAYPYARLIMDAAGNLYGTTTHGGAGDQGVVFELGPDGTETVLYTFCPQAVPCPDGADPSAGLIMDAAGNLYGTTYAGGTSGACTYGCGTVFELSPDATGTVWTETVLYSFQGGAADGAGPVAALIMDTAGNLYGTTGFGGTSNNGVVFELAPDGTETVLYSFCMQANCADGANPVADLIMDAAGNLYGTTFNGGTTASCYGCGVVFELSPDATGTVWTETVLYSFCAQANCADGAFLEAGVIMDAAGNLYGTAGAGPYPNGRGIIFKLAPDGTATVIYSFCAQSGCADGAEPAADLIIDAAGNLYGTTVAGGTFSHGVVFALTP